MKKTDKKTENRIREVLTDVCELALDQFAGFSWLTHFANYNDFPNSLSVLCVYETNEQLEAADRDALRTLIKDKLASMGVHLKDIRQRVSFDTEEECSRNNDGNWTERLRQ